MYDLIVIGSGPAGYVAAERAGEVGLSVLLIEKDEHLGGVCLNTGCIPTKSMLYSAKVYDHTCHAEAFGVKAESVTFDYAAVKTRTEGVQDMLRKGIAGLMKKNKVEVVKGTATILAPGKVAVDGTEYQGANLLISTGSRPFIPPIPGLEGNDKVLTNVELLALGEMPGHLCVIGAGVIGTEFASFYAMAGKTVTMIEMLPQICGNTDTELAKTLQKKIEGKGVTVHLGATVTGVQGGKVTFKDKKGEEQSIDADKILVATGRAANVDGIGLETIGVDFDRSGIKVNDKAETNVPHVYAAGDVTGRWQLAHFASRQATVAVNNIAGKADTCREHAVPAVVYTDPEIASVGLTEAQAKEQGIAVKTAKLPFAVSGRFLAETSGDRAVVKILASAENDQILGLHMIGPHVSEMLATACAAIEMEMRVTDLREVIFPHPTISEVIYEAAWAVH